MRCWTSRCAGGVDLAKLLDRLNRRIVALLDSYHQIGHSYFLNVRTLADLRFAWDRRVVPVLQEYFYNDPVFPQSTGKIVVR